MKQRDLLPSKGHTVMGENFGYMYIYIYSIQYTVYIYIYVPEPESRGSIRTISVQKAPDYGRS